MKTKLICLVLLLFLFSNPILLKGAGKACEDRFTTTFRVLDCSGEPVPDATVKIEILCGRGGVETKSTDSDGKAVFPYYPSEIKGRALGMGPQNRCERETDTNFICNILVCTSN